MKRFKKVFGLAVLALGCISLIHPWTVFAAPLPQSEVDALAGWTNWVGSCPYDPALIPPVQTVSRNAPVVVIDPGESGQDTAVTDPQTGLYDHELNNSPEITEDYSIAKTVSDQLTSAGYDIVSTKSSVYQNATARQRADVADQASASLAVSIHVKDNTSWTNMGNGQGGAVYVQSVGAYRQNSANLGNGTAKVSFTDAAVASISQSAGKIFAQTRTKDESHKVTVATPNYDGVTGQPGGNIPEEELFATTPWVYNDIGAPSGGLSTTQENNYAQGIVDSVEKAVPLPPNPASAGASCCPSASTASANGASVPGDVSGSQGVWSSGLQPPYIVEQYAINVLEDLAKKKGIPQTDTVTSQHVLALVTWAIIEGGDLENTDLFNLWNTSQQGSDLGGTVQTTGNMAYPTFDQGVEAAARTIDDGNHNTMLSALISPSSSAQDFAHAESYSGTTPGTLIWAGAAKQDPAGYYNNVWLQTIQTVQSNYSHFASYVIGTPAFEESTNQTDPALLSKINNGVFTVSAEVNSGGGCSASGSGSQSSSSIVQEALKLAWPTPFSTPTTDRPTALAPTQAYQAAMQQYNTAALGLFDGADCGAFVSTVMRASGADKNYPQSGTGTQWSYVVSHPELYDIQYNVTSMSQLQPGDILIVGGPGGTGGAGHTWIYVGNQPGGYYSASASEGQRSGNLTNDQLQDPIASGSYMRARLK